MQINTVKLLIAQTNLAPINRHSGSTRNEPIPRTTYANKAHYSYELKLRHTNPGIAINIAKHTIQFIVNKLIASSYRIQ
jgi:hypothetical protein